MITARPPLTTIAAIAAAPILLLSGFAWAGGWIGPPRIGGGTIADALESNAGKHEGYRRAHAKGVCFTGYFDASGGAGALSRTPLLRSGRHAVIGRFSTGGGKPFATDGRNVFRAMALQLTGPDGEIWRERRCARRSRRDGRRRSRSGRLPHGGPNAAAASATGCPRRRSRRNIR